MAPALTVQFGFDPDQVAALTPRYLLRYLRFAQQMREAAAHGA